MIKLIFNKNLDCNHCISNKVCKYINSLKYKLLTAVTELDNEYVDANIELILDISCENII
jgi:hypothetical protein